MVPGECVYSVSVSGAASWPYLQLMQVTSHGGQIQVCQQVFRESCHSKFPHNTKKKYRVSGKIPMKITVMFSAPLPSPNLQNLPKTGISLIWWCKTQYTDTAGSPVNYNLCKFHHLRLQLATNAQLWTVLAFIVITTCWPNFKCQVIKSFRNCFSSRYSNLSGCPSHMNKHSSQQK